jgi:hypothetical protein
MYNDRMNGPMKVLIAAARSQGGVVIDVFGKHAIHALLWQAGGRYVQEDHQ